MIERASEPTTTYGVSGPLPDAEDPTIIGSTGKIHGASTVKIPARNDMARNTIVLFHLCDKRRKCRNSAPFLDEVSCCIDLHEGMLIRNAVLLFQCRGIVIIHI